MKDILQEEHMGLWCIGVASFGRNSAIISNILIETFPFINFYSLDNFTKEIISDTVNIYYFL